MNSLRFFITLLSCLIMAVCGSGCSKDQYDPEDNMTSVLSGEYGYGKFWTLNTILNGDTVKAEGFVRFDVKPAAEFGDFRFVNVIPGESFKEFKNVELLYVKGGYSLSIDYPKKPDNIHISGTVTLGEMTVDMTISE